jgi:hypothetical protein
MGLIEEVGFHIQMWAEVWGWVPIGALYMLGYYVSKRLAIRWTDRWQQRIMND